ncbi:MAG: gamma-glutamyltransferase [Gammaproteobacteria bacterium]|nr:gamma-glutamyltransferase [Gammaproteobacteria bacterium]NIR83328.1 gamma-glutamyltransferase [Gammaproteobacteria bacterium]NIR91128.1 gamma-glutamyltransferase [Gammaproteobacteria bacterium]NIU04495.1 gamma-glutamyltransferase [Gammaproteobacteria bacterium]NIW87131.1 gamma-glutamyltransferase [Gammaproteobacteria bacterium]
MRDNHYPGRSVVMSTRGMVATSQPMATTAGLEVLRRGGNAMDAAVAAGATLCVTEPQSTGIGGDCFMLYHDAATGRPYGLNGSGRSPAQASAAAIRERGHTQMPEYGILSVTVPGAVHAWHTALARFGSMSLREVLAPAIACAEEGYAVTEVVARGWKLNEAFLAGAPDTARALLADGRAPQAGTRHRQPRLARSLKRIAEGGPEVFYQGEIAEQIVHFSEANGGLLAVEDFAEHRSEWVEPIATDYRGLRVFELPPNAQGIVALMMLNVLADTGLDRMTHLGVDHVHALVEAFRLALAERDRFVCDPDFENIPVAELLSPDFAVRQRRRMDPKQALTHPLPSGLSGQRDTVYLTVVDEQRNAASFINSLYHPWGSGLVAGETGILLQNRGGGFVLEEGHFNRIAPRKRPMHTIIPALAYGGAQPVFSFGVMGGNYQPMGHAYVLSNWLDFGMNPQEAVDAPRFGHDDGALVVERGVSADTRRELGNRGHRVVESEKPLGGAQCIYIDWAQGVLQGASDPRKDGCALGY